MSRRILIAEDSPTQGERARLLLAHEGYHVELVRNGREALRRVMEQPPDLVVSDVVMPEVDGFALCKAIKTAEFTRRIPVVLLTSQRTPADILRGLEHGADNFITKPYDDGTLLTRVRNIFQNLELRQEQPLQLEVRVAVGGREIVLSADKQQIIELLFSTAEEMSALNARLSEEVGERRRAQAAAMRAQQESDQANQAKSEFLSRMSHELRTPLNVILGFGQLLGMSPRDQTDAEHVEQILKAGRHLLTLINEVLDITRIEAGRVEMSPEPVAVGEAVRRVLDLTRPLAVDRRIELATHGGALLERHVWADHHRLQQVLLNLVSNGIKYNREGGRLTVACTVAPAGRLRIAVTDTGPGIPPALRTRLFQPFDRLGAERLGVEGTGLGLALSKRLVEMMGGEVGVDSEEGVGSTFWVELETAEAPIERQTRLEGPAGPIATATGRRGTILYIEDNPSNLKLVEHVLAQQGGVRLMSAMQGRIPTWPARWCCSSSRRIPTWRGSPWWSSARTPRRAG
jgi:signal transduction histidine kinase